MSVASQSLSADCVLGYDPRPHVHAVRGTPIPPVADPLPATPTLIQIASRMWCNGPPWTILRNREHFLRHATDHATDKECEHLWEVIPRTDWIAMLKASRPGSISMRSWKFWMWRAGLLDERLSIPPEWHQPRHIRDLIHLNRRSISTLRKLVAQEKQSHAA